MPQAAPAAPAAPTTPPPPPPSPTATPTPTAPRIDLPPRPTRAASRHVDKDADDEEYEDYDLEEYIEVDEFDEFDLVPSRWSGLFVTAGAGIIGLITLQVLMTLLEGISQGTGERFAVPDDLFHRLGYPFGSLGLATLFFLIGGVLLIVLPLAFGEGVSDGQYKVAVVTLRTAIILAVVIALGSVLAVRGTLHANTSKDLPSYFLINLTSFLLCTLAATALTIFTAVTALKLRDEES